MDTPITTQAAPTEQYLQQVVEGVSLGIPLGRMLGFDKRELEAAYSVGHGLYQQGQYEAAAKVFSFAASHDHLERRYVKAWASALQMNGKYSDAVPLYAMASIMDLNDPAPSLHICECLIALGMNEEAIACLEEVTEMCKCDTAHQQIAVRAAALLQLLRRPTGTSPTKETQ